MERKIAGPGLPRLSKRAPLSDTEQRAKADIKRVICTHLKTEPTLREHIRHDQVAFTEHFIRICRSTPAVARKLAEFADSYGGYTPPSADDIITMFVQEATTQGGEDALQAKWVAGRATPAEKVELRGLFLEHVAELQAQAHALTADLYAGAGR